ncbi:MAG: hypothetical protein WC870_01795 [Candidatus Paceibacterota bacterium]
MEEKNDVNVSGNSSPSSKKGNQTIMGVLAYLGILILVPFFMAKENPFVKFHIKQGLVLVVIELIIWALRPMFWSYPMSSFIQILDLAIIIFIIMGIINVVQGREKELPLIGQFSRYFSF